MIVERHGFKFNVRENTSDQCIIYEVFRARGGGDYRYMSLKCSDRVLDLGGNIGTYAMLINNKVRNVVSFEPDKSNIELYEKNMVDNNINNCKVIPYAVIGNDDKERQFGLSNSINKGSHSLLVTKGKKREVVTVPCMNINDILNIGNFNKIKIDIEGSEYEVLKGIKSFKQIEEMIIEYHFNMIKEYYEEIQNLLKSNYNNVNVYKTPKGWNGIIHCFNVI